MLASGPIRQGDVQRARRVVEGHAAALGQGEDPPAGVADDGEGILGGVPADGRGACRSGPARRLAARPAARAPVVESSARCPARLEPEPRERTAHQPERHRKGEMLLVVRCVGHRRAAERQAERLAAGGVEAGAGGSGPRSAGMRASVTGLERGLEDHLAVADPAPHDQARLAHGADLDGGGRSPASHHPDIGVVADPVAAAVPHEVGAGRRLERAGHQVVSPLPGHAARVGIVRVRGLATPPHGACERPKLCPSSCAATPDALGSLSQPTAERPGT